MISDFSKILVTIPASDLNKDLPMLYAAASSLMLNVENATICIDINHSREQSTEHSATHLQLLKELATRTSNELQITWHAHFLSLAQMLARSIKLNANKKYWLKLDCDLLYESSMYTSVAFNAYYSIQRAYVTNFFDITNVRNWINYSTETMTQEVAIKNPNIHRLFDRHFGGIDTLRAILLQEKVWTGSFLVPIKNVLPILPDLAAWKKGVRGMDKFVLEQFEEVWFLVGPNVFHMVTEPLMNQKWKEFKEGVIVENLNG